MRATLQDLESSRAQIRAQNEELTLLATRDPLTGCLNRRAFFTALEPLFERLRREGRSLGCLMVDIDHFKSINDRFGHAVGDQVIKRVAETLAKGLRDCDLLCRYGGEEYCAILPALSLDEATAVAERLRLQIERTIGQGLEGIDGLSVTVSFGVSVTVDSMSKVTDLIRYADEGLYRAKRAGRNRTRRTVYLDSDAEATPASA